MQALPEKATKRGPVVEEKKSQLTVARENSHKQGPGAGGSALAAGAGKGSISQLQEFVQGARAFPMPPSCPVLQWCHDTRMVDSCLEFRATVSFLLDGVPHHTVGSWKPSKKQAQRDVSERALGLFVGHWGDFVGLDGAADVDTEMVCVDTPQLTTSSMEPLEDLQHYCTKLAPPPNCPPRWSHVLSDSLYQAFVEVVLFGIPHTFPGKRCQSQEVAYDDCARRVLWYLQQPGYEDAFEPDMEFAKVAAQDIPEPASCWAKESLLNDRTGEEEQALAERKTAVMRVQNRLQQAYARKLEAGTSVWYWSYDRDPKDKSWPPLFRAIAHVPLAGKTFVGGWVRGQREAQIDTCTQISEFLDVEFANTR